MKRLVAVVVLCSLAAACASGRQVTPGPTPAGDTPSGWVDVELAPVLAKRLSTHPRFAGQALVIGLPDGVHEATRLESRLNGILESRLLHSPGLRVAASPEGGCSPGDYRLGFTVLPVEGGWRVELRVLETESGEWVTGLADSWQGPLSRQDRADQHLPARDEFQGSLSRPFGAGDPEPLARSLARALSCELVSAGLAPGPVAASPDSGTLGPRISAVLAELPHPRGSGLRWQLDVDRQTVGTGLTRVTAVLASSRRTLSVARYVADGASALPNGPAPLPRPPVLSAVDCGPGCAGVRLRGDARSALFAVGPGGRLENAKACRVAATSRPGDVVELHTGRAGVRQFIALAAAPGYARRVEALVDRAPPACGSAAPRRSPPTLGELERLAAEAGPSLALTRLYVDAGLPRRAGNWR